jgi:hypothetical protein
MYSNASLFRIRYWITRAILRGVYTLHNLLSIEIEDLIKSHSRDEKVIIVIYDSDDAILWTFQSEFPQCLIKTILKNNKVFLEVRQGCSASEIFLSNREQLGL